MKYLRQGLAAAAAVAVVSALSLQSSAVAAPPMNDSDDSAAIVRPDYLPNPLGDKRRAEKLRALAAVTSGEAQVEQRGRSIGAVVDGKFVEQAVSGEDEIFVVMTEFGDQIHPEYGGDPGPMHNMIEEPDRSVDNTTIWQADYNREHYEKIYSETADNEYASLANFVEEMSSGRYTVNGQVQDWVQLDYNEARYGSDHDQTEQYWAWVSDSVNYWWDQNCVGSEAACEEQLAALDRQDRYDYDDDGNYQEPDGYLDHFQLIHAGVGEETGGGAQGTDAIWSHRWHVNLDDVGFTGPTVPGTEDVNLHGGAQIGDSAWWVGDYTAQPENGGLGVFAHEYMHDLELPDEYATDGVENDTGFWTLMSSGSYFSQEDGIIGDRAAGLNIWDKAFLGWVSPDDGSLIVNNGDPQAIEVGPAAIRHGEHAQGAVINLPERELTIDTPDPVEGEWEWWSFYGDLLENSITTTTPLDLSGATEVELTAEVNYEIEEGYDYLYGEVSTDDGLSWTRLNGTVNGEPIWEEGEVEGLGGTTEGEWVPLTYDMSDWAGEASVLFRFSYMTDGGLALQGFFADDIAISADGTEIFADGAEEGESPWTADGFVRSQDQFVASYPQRYWIENRQLVGADAGFDNSPYNFFDPERPDWVEHYAYQTDGVQLWYNWDAFADNNVGGHPGVGLILPIDVQSEPFSWSDDTLVRPRIQSYDAALSLEDTPEITLHRADAEGVPVENVFGGLPAVSMFDDVNGVYWHEEMPNHGVILEPIGTTVELISMNEQCDGTSSATLSINGADAAAPEPPNCETPSVTPTLPPTGGDSSSSLAGIGLAAVLAGGLLVAFAARRLRQD